MAIGDGVSAIASLALTFGGFSPTAMDGVEATRAQIERVEAAQARKKAADERKRQIDRARASAPKSFTDDDGQIWTYVVLDDKFVRIDKCKREVARVFIPATIDGKPVKALGSDIFHESETIEEIVCPDCIESIGACAFRLLANLKRIVFPDGVAVYSGSWLQHCTSIREIVLPGLLDEITSHVFENASLRKLVIGRAVLSVKPGAFEKTLLDELVIDDANPFIQTDGDAIYSHDKAQLIALARPVKSYRVADGCLSTARKACMGIASLESVELPDSLHTIGEFSFAHTGLKHVDVPKSVVNIESKAFFHCAQLKSVGLVDGLRYVGDSAFAESALESIHIPASIEKLGTSITAKTNVVHSGENVTFEIAPESKSLFTDGQGGLYRREVDGIYFVQLVDALERDYTVIDGTTYIDEYAFAFHNSIECVKLPEGLREIRKSAFRVCPRLRSVTVPESLEFIGKEAFLDTVIESIYLPEGFKELSEDALVTAGAHRMGEPPSLHSIEVAPGNERYYVESGLLCSREPAGDRGIVFNDAVADVVVPDRVTSIAPFAFSNARNIRSVSIGPNLKTIGTAGFSVWSHVEDIHIELEEPLEGRTVFDVNFPETPRTRHEISNSLGGSAWVNVPDIYRHYDNCVAHAHNYHSREDNETSAYEQAKRMTARLKDPILLAPVNRSMFERTIREHLVEMCVDIARHDDREVVNDLCDLGFLNADTIEGAIVEVGKLQDAAMSGYLLELKRRRFGSAAFDFDL